MSYPPDPQNPYGQPPPQQPYGYSQQPPPPYGYGFGYPGQPGYPGMRPEMPGMLKAARVILFVLAGLVILGGLLSVLAAVAVTRDSDTSVAHGVLVFVVVFLFAIAAIAIVLGVRFAKGGSAVRVCTIIYSAFWLLAGLGNLARGPVGVVTAVFAFAVGGFLLAAVVRADAGAWFNRPRY